MHDAVGDLAPEGVSVFVGSDAAAAALPTQAGATTSRPPPVTYDEIVALMEWAEKVVIW